MIDEKKLIKDLEETVRVSVKSGDCTARKLLGLFMVVITNQPKVGEWIPCSERLPENAKQKGAPCPIYQVMTQYGVTEGWYNPDHECWYILVWFLSENFEESNINLEKGDIPKRLQVPAGTVIAWKPKPEPWEGNEHAERKANKTEVENE